MKDKAFAWLENAVDRGFINYPFISEYDPFLEKIRGEPRFKKLMNSSISGRTQIPAFLK
jgi:hypothetical protein